MPEITRTEIRHIEPMLMHYALRAVRAEDVANDLVQETWAAALTSLPRFEGRSTLRTWVVGILRRKIIDHRRRQKDTTPYEDEFQSPKAARVAEREIDHSAALEMVQEELSGLPALERKAVELCVLQDLDRPEAARRMGVSDGHLRVLLHRGRHRLMGRLSAAGHTLH